MRGVVVGMKITYTDDNKRDKQGPVRERDGPGLPVLSQTGESRLRQLHCRKVAREEKPGVVTILVSSRRVGDPPQDGRFEREG